MQLYLYLLDDIDTQPININGMGGRTLRHAKTASINALTNEHNFCPHPININGIG